MEISLDYPINPKARWTTDKTNKALLELIKSNDKLYAKNLNQIECVFYSKCLIKVEKKFPTYTMN